MSVYMAIRLSASMTIYLCAYITVCLFVYMTVCLYNCVYIKNALNSLINSQLRNIKTRIH